MNVKTRHHPSLQAFLVSQRPVSTGPTPLRAPGNTGPTPLRATGNTGPTPLRGPVVRGADDTVDHHQCRRRIRLGSLGAIKNPFCCSKCRLESRPLLRGSSGSTGQLNDASSSSSSLTNSQHFRSNPAINLEESGGGCDTSQQCLIRPLPPIPGSPKQASSGSIPVSQPAPLVSNGTSKGHSESEKNALSARRQIESLRSEVTFLRKQLGQCQESIVRLQQRETTLQDRLSEQAQKHFNTGASKFEDLNLGENRPSALVRRYGNLYSEVRLDTFDALDDLPEIADFDDLKGKLLFSVVVLAFRSVQRALTDLRQKIRDLLCLRTDSGDDSKSSGADTSELAPIVSELEQMIGIYMRKSIDTFDISRNIQEVCNQVYATLYDYPTLRQCERLKTYISECVHISWALSVQHPPFVISYESKLFSDSMHTRFHSSDPDSDVIQSVLWPSLLEGGSDGACVHKGVVIT